MAEARSAVTLNRVHDLEEGRDPKKDFITAWRKAAFRRYFRTRQVRHTQHTVYDLLVLVPDPQHKRYRTTILSKMGR